MKIFTNQVILLNKQNKLNDLNLLSFKSAKFVDYNPEYSNKKDLLMREIEQFISNDSLVKIGEGVSGNVYRFNNPQLSDFVIKRAKIGNSEDYKLEYKNLMMIPTEKIGGQKAIARVYDSQNNVYYLVSTMVNGHSISTKNKLNKQYIRNNV